MEQARSCKSQFRDLLANSQPVQPVAHQVPIDQRANYQLPKPMIRFTPPGLLDEHTWRSLGVRQSLG